MQIAISSDHGAFVLKGPLTEYLISSGHDVIDLGVESAQHRSDFPMTAGAVAQAVISGQAVLGITMCGTGIGASIAANKYDGIRAALCHDVTTARLAREHNDANVLCLGGRMIGFDLAVEIVDAFVGGKFLDLDRYNARNQQLRDIEQTR